MPPFRTSPEAPYAPWNKGKPQGRKTPLTAEQVRTIKALLAADNALRDLALFSVAIDTMLRSVDLLALTVGDCTDHEGKVLSEFLVRQRKTGKGVTVALSPTSAATLARWIRDSGKHRFDPLFTGLRKGQGQAISASTYRQLVKQWVRMARLGPRHYSTHSLRRTKAALVYDATGNVEAVRHLLGQSSIAATSRYLGVDERAALTLASRIQI